MLCPRFKIYIKNYLQKIQISIEMIENAIGVKKEIVNPTSRGWRHERDQRNLDKDLENYLKTSD